MNKRQIWQLTLFVELFLLAVAAIFAPLILSSTGDMIAVLSASMAIFAFALFATQDPETPTSHEFAGLREYVKGIGMALLLLSAFIGFGVNISSLSTREFIYVLVIFLLFLLNIVSFLIVYRANNRKLQRTTGES